MFVNNGILRNFSVMWLLKPEHRTKSRDKIAGVTSVYELTVLFKAFSVR